MPQNEYTGCQWIDQLIDEIPELADAYKYGVDIEMLVSNIKRPVEDRLRRHQIALQTYDMMRNARRVNTTS